MPYMKTADGAPNDFAHPPRARAQYRFLTGAAAFGLVDLRIAAPDERWACAEACADLLPVAFPERRESECGAPTAIDHAISANLVTSRLHSLSKRECCRVPGEYLAIAKRLPVRNETAIVAIHQGAISGWDKLIRPIPR